MVKVFPRPGRLLLPEEYEARASWENDCLIYPATCRAAANHRARRIYQLRHPGVETKGLCVCHTCDRPECINDEHHFLGTHADNMRDAASKGRLRNTLTKEDYIKIGLKQKGKKLSEAHIARLREFNTGRKASKETLEKMRQASINRSDETRKKMSESAKKRWENRSEQEKVECIEKMRNTARKRGECLKVRP